ncbi:unnamed protein product [Phytophthora fragariaefolia]|uniref:Unnamed protein product n=1 Tax=Phytophthora fragariaefolia TaxID=1490495 RepID=A0A9W6Y383_9STRA|nr:unnamed protein product [Phytophthora fragariaefolia]
MAASTLPRGSFLLVFPEDVEGAIASPVYAKIKSSRGATATVTLVNEGDDSETTLKLARATALTRKVDSSDAEGSKLRTWIRQAVCVKHEGHYNFGQVTGYSDVGLIIYTLSGPIEASRTDICDTVYPVVALVIGCQVFPEETWSYEQLDQIHDTLMDRLLKPSTTNAPCDPLSIAQLVQGVLPDMSPGFDRLCYWTDARTGKRSRISLQHVVNYVYYVDGGKRMPARMEGTFGSTFCTPPVQDMHPQQQDPTARPEHQTTAPATRSSFFDVLDVDDGEETAADEAALAQTILAGVNESTSPTLTVPPNRMQHPRHTASSPATNPTYAVPPNLGSSAAAPAQLYQEASEEAEIRDLFRTHKPHLLTYQLESRRAPTNASARPGFLGRGPHRSQRILTVLLHAVRPSDAESRNDPLQLRR